MITFICCQNSNQKKVVKDEYKKMICYFFFIPDCPVCENNFAKVNILQQKYKNKGLEIKAIYSDPLPDTISLNEIRNKMKIQINFDFDLKLAKKYNIITTPQYVLFDSLGNEMYNGMLDNYYYALGKHRTIITEHYLANAIESILEGKKPKINFTNPIGCKINYQLTKY